MNEKLPLSIGLLAWAVFLGQPAVVMLGWNWHISPAFELPRIGYWLAMTIWALVGLLTIQHIPRTHADKIVMVQDEAWRAIVTLVLIVTAKWLS